MEHLFERQARLNVMKRPVHVVTYFFLIPGLIVAYLLGFYQRLNPSLDKPCFSVFAELESLEKSSGYDS